MGLERQVRKEPMVTNRNGKSARAEHQKEKQDLEPINPEEIKIGRDCSQRENQRANEKRAGWPINFFERNLRKHGVGGCLGAEGGTTGKLRCVQVLLPRNRLWCQEQEMARSVSCGPRFPCHTFINELWLPLSMIARRSERNLKASAPKRFFPDEAV